MKKIFLLFLFFLISTNIVAQTDNVFDARIYNREYQVYLHINFYKNNIIIPEQELLGETPGYLGAKRDSRKWLITSVKIENKYTATLEITNDYGSEDLIATLIFNPKDGSYILKQNTGSRIKIVENRKWVKLPTELKFVQEQNH